MNEGNSLRIESSGVLGTGSLTTSGKEGYAAIGGDSGHESGNITIVGGRIDATVYSYGVAGAGIGGGNGHKAGTITITGGNISANVLGGAFGIGKGAGCGEVSNIIIDNALSVSVNSEPVVPASSYSDSGDPPMLHMVSVTQP